MAPRSIPAQRLVRRRMAARGWQRRNHRPHRVRPEDGAMAQGRRRDRGARGRLLAPAAAALHGSARRRQPGVPLSRPRLRFIGPLHAHALAGQAQSECLCALLPGAREVPLRLGMARRSGRRGSRARAGPALERRSRLGRRRRNAFPQLRLPPRDRQPDGPDARDLRPFHEHRPYRGRRDADQDQRTTSAA